MKKIVIKDDFAFLYFTNKFYRKKIIESSLKDYKEFVESSIKEVGDYFVVKVKLISDDYSLNTISDEIFNHVLASENECR